MDMKKVMMVTVTLLGVFATTLSGGERDTSKISDLHKKLLGCWQRQEGGKTISAVIDKKRLIFFVGNTVRKVFIIKQVKKDVLAFPLSEISAHGEDDTLKYALAGDTLTLIFNGNEEQTFKKITPAPPGLNLNLLSLGKPVAIKKKEIARLRKEFKKRITKDQAVRKDPSQRKNLGTVDRNNTAWLLKLIAKDGWIDAKRFGEKNANGAFLIVQHSGNLNLMLTALPEIEKDVKAKRLRDGQNYALLFDRVQLRLGNKQRYGTQIGKNRAGKGIVLPLEDPANVEKRRKEIGLFPLAMYLKFYEQRLGQKIEMPK